VHSQRPSSLWTQQGPEGQSRSPGELIQQSPEHILKVDKAWWQKVQEVETAALAAINDHPSTQGWRPTPPDQSLFTGHCHGKQLIVGTNFA